MIPIQLYFTLWFSIWSIRLICLFMVLCWNVCVFRACPKTEGYGMMLVLFFCCNSCCLLLRKTTIENERYLWSMSGSTLELTHNHGAEMDENFKVPTTPGWFKGLIYSSCEDGKDGNVKSCARWIGICICIVYVYIACINWGLTKPCNIVILCKSGKGSSPIRKGPSLTFTIGWYSVWQDTKNIHISIHTYNIDIYIY